MMAWRLSSTITPSIRWITHRTTSTIRHHTYTSILSTRFYTNVSYDEVNDVIKSRKLPIIDVRERDEYTQGAIPGACNLPLSEFTDALDLSPVKFKDIYGFDKPSTTNGVVFYCVAGVRSARAAMLAEQFGYTKAKNYAGSYMDWVQRQQQQQ